MNRRFFIKSLITVAAAASLPIATIHKFVSPTDTRNWAIKRLTAWWLKETKGSGGKYNPKRIMIGSDLYDAYESQLESLQRFTNGDDVGYQTLLFKLATVIRSDFPGYWIKRLA